MSEFEISGQNYRSGRLNAFQQFHVARKLGPIFAKLGPTLASGALSPDAPIDLLAPMLEALAEMSEEDCNYVLNRCLAVVQRQQGQIWVKIYNEPAKMMQFEDIDMAMMLQITIEVLKDNLGNFLSSPTATSPPQPSQESTIPPNLSPFPMVRTG